MGGSVAERLVEVAAGAGAHLVELLRREALLVVAVVVSGRSAQYIAVRSIEEWAARGQAHKHVLGVLHAGRAAQILKALGDRFDEVGVGGGGFLGFHVLSLP